MNQKTIDEKLKTIVIVAIDEYEDDDPLSAIEEVIAQIKALVVESLPKKIPEDVKENWQEWAYQRCLEDLKEIWK